MSEDIDIGQISEALNDKMDRDAGNPATLGKETIVGWGMPDYSAGVSKPVSGFTSDKKGFVCGSSETLQNNAATINVNSVQVFRLAISGSASCQGTSSLFPVDVGDVVAGTHLSEMTFFPTKGV